MKQQILHVFTVVALAYPMPGYCFFDCPFGATLVGDPPPKSTEQYCQKQDKAGNMIRHGKYTSWYSNGKLREKSYYVNGQLDGLFESFLQDGSPKQRIVRKNGQIQESKHYYSDDGRWSLTRYDSGIQVGVDFYFPNGKIRSRLPQKDGRNHGKCEDFDENGTKIAEMQWVDGKRVSGEEIDDGPAGSKLVVTTDSNGITTGKKFWGGWMNYSETIDASGSGEQKRWHRNGKLASLTVFKNGRYVGLSRNWDERGKELKPTKSANQLLDEIVGKFTKK